jgi:hypothetical protein
LTWWQPSKLLVFVVMGFFVYLFCFIFVHVYLWPLENVYDYSVLFFFLCISFYVTYDIIHNYSCHYFIQKAILKICLDLLSLCSFSWHGLSLSLSRCSIKWHLYCLAHNIIDNTAIAIISYALSVHMNVCPCSVPNQDVEIPDDRMHPL